MSFYQDYKFHATGVALTAVTDFTSAVVGTKFEKSTGEVFEKTAAGIYKKVQGSASNVSYDIDFIAGYNAKWEAKDAEVKTYRKMTLSRDVTFGDIFASLEVAPVGANLYFDVEINGTTIFSALPYFANGSTTLTQGTLSTTSANAGDVITFKVAQIGSTTAGSGLTGTLSSLVEV